MKLSQELTIKILQLRSEGLGTRKIAETVGINRCHIQQFYKEQNLNHQNPPKKNKTEQKCKICEMVKP